MATQVQWRGGSTAEHATFTGAAREVTVDTQKKTLVVHDGSTAGGEPLLREDQANLPSSVTNGIYTPSANNVALATNGTGRLFVNADGTIQASSNSFYVVNTIDTQIKAKFLQNSNSAPLLSLLNNDESGYFDVSVARSGGGGHAIIQTGADLVFKTGGATERARITSTGTLMHLGAGNSTTPAVQFNGSAPSNSLVIDSTGKVGLGTSSPTNDRLHIRESVAAGISLEASGTGGSTWRIVSTDDTASLGGGYLGVNNGGYRFVISSAGNVGIGTTSPGYSLDVNGSINIADNQLIRSGGQAMIARYSGSNAVFVGSGTATDSLVFSAGGNEKARIDTAGRLLVGTSSTAQTSTLVLQGRGSATGSAIVRVGNRLQHLLRLPPQGKRCPANWRC
jgi:hypothetical protein